MQKKRNYHKSVHDREQYKRIVSFLSAVSLVALLTMVFAHTWYTYYADIIQLPFYRRGNWVVIAIYAVILFLFFKVYGGFKVGYLRRTDVLLSQILSVFGTNVLAYLQISLIARHFEAVRPVIVLTMKELVVLVLWTLLAQRLYFALYPPRRLIIVYGSPAAAALVTKMSYRVDKYMICESISAVKDYSMICDKILQYDGVIIHDIPAQMRNDLVKFCFDHKLRAYIVPKISDIILRGAEDIRLKSRLRRCRTGHQQETDDNNDHPHCQQQVVHLIKCKISFIHNYILYNSPGVILRNLFTEIYALTLVMMIPNSNTATAVITSSRQVMTTIMFGS